MIFYFIALTRPYPIAFGHFGSNLNRSVGETKRIGRHQTGRLNGINNINTRSTNETKTKYIIKFK